MNAIDWINEEIAGLEATIHVLKSQRTILMGAVQSGAEPKVAKPVIKTADKPTRKRTSGIKEAVVEVLNHCLTGIATADIINSLPLMAEGSIRAALGGLKAKGIARQDGKMWFMADAINWVGNSGAGVGEEITA